MLLAIDTSTRLMGLALYDGVQIIHESTWLSSNYHTVQLAPAIAEAMQRSGVAMEQLSVLAVAGGPGSFTGLRIGMAVAKGIALARNLPLIGIPSLDIIAAAQPLAEADLAAVLQAGRGRLAVGWYTPAENSWQPRGAPEGMTADELAERIHSPTCVAGELTEDERRRLARKWRNVRLASPAQALRRPAFLAELAWARWQAGQHDDPVSLAPVYLPTLQGTPA